MSHLMSFEGIWSDIGFVLAGYLLGAFPHLYLLGRARGLKLSGDLHMELWRKGGRPLGIIGFLLELVKGIIPIVVGRALGVETAILVTGGVAAVVGQMWPAFHHFDGEKGNSIGAAMAVTLSPGPFWIALIFMLTGYLIRTVPRFARRGESVNEKLKLGGPPSLSFPLGMFTGFGLLPLIAWLWGEPTPVVIGYVALFLLILLRRATAGITADIKEHKKLGRVIMNRLLFDRANI
jgi:glycerol-3-phosphate acyltransferase PlsY